MSVLDEACDELRTRLAVFTVLDSDADRADGGLATFSLLLAEPDVQPASIIRRGHPGSRPPWNTAAAGVYFDIHQLVRRLEASIRRSVTGKPGRMRSGSDKNTRLAIDAIAKLGSALPDDDAREAARLLTHAASRIGQLPAIDETPRWEPIRPGPGGLPPRCPNCRTFSLRVCLATGVVICVKPSCADLDGGRPQAKMEVGRYTGTPMLAWADGTVQTAPA